MTKKNKNYERSEISELKQTIRSLKAKLAHRDAKIKRLISEIKTLNKAFDQSVVYIDKKLADYSVEEIVSYFNNDAKGASITDMQHQIQEAEERSWECYKCDDGTLRLIIINKRNEEWYFRSCNNCKNRTRMKKYKKGVK